MVLYMFIFTKGVVDVGSRVVGYTVYNMLSRFSFDFSEPENIFVFWYKSTAFYYLLCKLLYY